MQKKKEKKKKIAQLSVWFLQPQCVWEKGWGLPGNQRTTSSNLKVWFCYWCEMEISPFSIQCRPRWLSEACTGDWKGIQTILIRISDEHTSLPCRSCRLLGIFLLCGFQGCRESSRFPATLQALTNFTCNICIYFLKPLRWRYHKLRALKHWSYDLRFQILGVCCGSFGSLQRMPWIHISMWLCWVSGPNERLLSCGSEAVRTSVPIIECFRLWAQSCVLSCLLFPLLAFVG